MVVRQETFTQRVVDAWNGLPGKVVAAEIVDKVKLEFDRYLEVMEIEGYRDVGRTFRTHSSKKEKNPAKKNYKNKTKSKHKETFCIFLFSLF